MTLFAIGLLVFFGVVAHVLSVYILNIAGLPGALIAGYAGANFENRKKLRYIVGTIVSILGQSFIYLAYTAFIVNWTRLVILQQDANFLVWPVAFLATTIPILIASLRARMEGKEDRYINAQIEALPVTWMIALICFFIFALFPSIMESLYFWVPYMGG